MESSGLFVHYKEWTGVLEEKGQKKRERAPMSVNEGMNESKLDCFTSVACWNPWRKNTSVREGMSSLHG